MIASVAFRNFKALRSASLKLEPFNLVIGPNGSGKTSLIQSIQRLRTLSKLPLASVTSQPDPDNEGPEITFHFNAPYDGLEAYLSCQSDLKCDLLQVTPLQQGDGIDDWPKLRNKLQHMRSYVFEHNALSAPAARTGDPGELNSNGNNLAAILADRHDRAPAAFSELVSEFCRILPEYEGIVVGPTAPDGRVAYSFKIIGESTLVAADSVSQGSLYLLAMLALVHAPVPPTLVCIEEIDRGIHPRLLREVRDSLYRLSHPSSVGLTRDPVQVIATTHSPYLLDLYRDHPDEVVIAEKAGRAATFSRLSERKELAALLGEGTLGDMWYAGVLGGVPEE